MNGVDGMGECAKQNIAQSNDIVGPQQSNWLCVHGFGFLGFGGGWVISAHQAAGDVIPGNREDQPR